MKATWQTVQLGDVCTFENGDRGENYPGRSAFVEAGIPIINAGHLSTVGIDTSEMNFITRERFDLLRAGKVRRGDVLFCLRGSLGKFAFNDCYDEGAIASSLIIIRPRSMLDVHFLCAYLDSSLCADMIKKFRNGAAQPNLGGKSLERFLIPLPPLEEQRRIVAVLEQAFAAIATASANAEKNLASLEELLSAAFRTAFDNLEADWPTRPFEACIGKAKCPAKIQRRDFKSQGMFPIISQEADFINGYWDDPQDVFKVPSPLLVFGDHTQVLKYVDFDFVLGADGVKILLPNSFLDARFLLYFLKANPMESKGYARHYRHLKSLTVPVPPLDEQKRIAAHLDDLADAVNILIAQIGAKLNLLDELKQSLLHRAFTGELTAAMPETIAA